MVCGAATNEMRVLVPSFVLLARRTLLQIVEDIADVAGLRTLGGHDCQRGSSESSKRGTPLRKRELTQTARLNIGV